MLKQTFYEDGFNSLCKEVLKIIQMHNDKLTQVVSDVYGFRLF